MRAALVALAAALVLAPASDAQLVIDDGHADYGARIVDGGLRSQIKDSTAGGAPVWREVESVRIRLDAAARATVPDGASWAFLGVPGATVWLIPQTQRAGVVWLGWNTEALTAADVAGDVMWRLDAVEGPGRVAVFQTGAFGQPDKLFDSGDGLPDARAVPIGTHAHGNWSFSRPGDYALMLAHSVQRAGGGTQSDTRILRVTVDAGVPGGQPPGEPPPGDAPPRGTPPGGPSAPGGGGAAPRRPRLALLRARARARDIEIRLTLERASRVGVSLRRRGRVAARARARAVRAGTRTVRFRLDRRPPPGRYVLRVRAQADGGAVVRSRRVRVHGPAR